MGARAYPSCGLNESKKMTFGFWETSRKVLVAIIGVSLPSVAAAGPISLGLSPSSIESDFVGTLSLRIGNLNAGMTVRVEAFADLNTNGIIDAGDVLLKSFEVTDGQVPLVAGVRNLNVPGDEDGLTNGAIQAVLHFPPAVGGWLALGRGLFRVSDPAGNLTSVTQAVSITQKLYPQRLTGRVTLTGTGLPLANSIVGLQPVVGTTPFSAPTDANGNYQFYCLPGVYGISGLNNDGAVYDQTQVVTVGCGQTVTNNLTLSTGTFYIAGRVTDNSTGLGIPALSVDATTGNNLYVLTLTDTNGNYVFRVTTNTWKVRPTTGGACEAGYVGLARLNVTVANNSVSNVNFVLSPPTALIYGTIKDALANPVVGVQMSAQGLPSNFHCQGRSFVTNASYSLGVQAGTWFPVPDGGDLGIRGFIGSGSTVTLVDGQVSNVNFVATRTNWPILQAPLHVGSSAFQFTLSGLAGQLYTIQRSTNLAFGNWVAALVTNAPCNTVLIQDPQATNNARFYRAVIVP
jgi:hypothetical protein